MLFGRYSKPTCLCKFAWTVYQFLSFAKKKSSVICLPGLLVRYNVPNVLLVNLLKCQIVLAVFLFSSKGTVVLVSFTEYR